MSKAVTVKNSPSDEQRKGDGPWRNGLLIQTTMNFYKKVKMANNSCVTGHASF